ncbi:MAG: PrsW family intramembrane metalloprotease [Candidatus Yanofskybacteria bacterium]|nr:PrsW family intramembrane metalloprotease [Candidatus Yanofskybacteria bacterium]
MSPFYAATLVVLGLAPSLVWLSFYLKKDCHPEPKSLLVKAFLMGIIISPLAVLLQLGFSEGARYFFDKVPDFLQQGAPAFFLWSSFVEEFLKFFAIYLVVVRSPAFDEPVDAMIYMITAALGFAAIENVLVMFGLISGGIGTALNTLALRFVGATLLHALASGLMGYFLAMSWFFREHKKKLLMFGLAIATLFHAAFNMLISFAQESTNPVIGLVYTTFLLIILAFLVSILFDKIKERDMHQLT